MDHSIRSPFADALASRALESVGAAPADLAWFRLNGVWQAMSLPRLTPGALARHCSHAWLEPGDLVATGTPAGVGTLKPGDVVEVEVLGISRVQNRVAAS